MILMGKFIVVEDDKVSGVDKHQVSGLQKTGSPPPSYKGIGEYDYRGRMVDQLSNFVQINSKPVAITSSKSSLKPGEASIGGHAGPNGKNFNPPTAEPTTLQITDNVGTGSPSATSGSSFVKINGIAILLDGDRIDTCDGLGITMNSSVTAQHQNFVSCSE
jgi:uncharacterized Zn-binding protein involved in type VI secretion